MFFVCSRTTPKEALCPVPEGPPEKGGGKNSTRLNRREPWRQRRTSPSLGAEESWPQNVDFLARKLLKKLDPRTVIDSAEVPFASAGVPLDSPGVRLRAADGRFRSAGVTLPPIEVADSSRARGARMSASSLPQRGASARVERKGAWALHSPRKVAASTWNCSIRARAGYGLAPQRPPDPVRGGAKPKFWSGASSASMIASSASDVGERRDRKLDIRRRLPDGSRHDARARHRPDLHHYLLASAGRFASPFSEFHEKRSSGRSPDGAFTPSP